MNRRFEGGFGGYGGYGGYWDDETGGDRSEKKTRLGDVLAWKPGRPKEECRWERQQDALSLFSRKLWLESAEG